MMLALALALYASTSAGSGTRPPAVASSDEPPIQVWLSSDNTFVHGERARVYVRPAQDGYVLVLRADGEGQVRVLFPIDPSDDAFVRGGKKFEVRDRGDRDAFIADDDGTGTVLVAWSATPFSFDGLVSGDHWDFGAFGAPDSSEDPEGRLVQIVQSAAVDSHFDYDVATYTVRSTTASNDSYVGASYAPTYSGWSVSLGWPYWYSGVGPFCGSYYWSSWGCGPYFGPYYGVGYRPYWYRPYGYGHYGYRPYGYGRYGYGRSGYGGFGYPTYRSRTAGYLGVAGGFRREPVRGSYAFRGGASVGGSRSGVRIAPEGRRVVIANRVFPRANGSRVTASGSRSYRDGGYARPSTGTRSSAAPRGERSSGSAPATRSAPSGGSRRGGGSNAAPRSSGGGRESGGGYSRGGGGGGGDGGRRGGGGGGGRHEGGGGGGGRRR